VFFNEIAMDIGKAGVWLDSDESDFLHGIILIADDIVPLSSRFSKGG
jgi:hypothetical protein